MNDCTSTPCGPPDGTVGVVAILDKFRNLTGAPLKARTDLEPNLSDLKISITDVTYVVGAFTGEGYAFEAFAGEVYPFERAGDPCGVWPGLRSTTVAVLPDLSGDALRFRARGVWMPMKGMSMPLWSVLPVLASPEQAIPGWVLEPVLAHRKLVAAEGPSCLLLEPCRARIDDA